ncbi:MAG: GNAT family N-acetyltransferase [Actinomycetes bacterium]
MIRPAHPGDVPRLLALVRELAEYERALHEVQAGEADLHAALFTPEPAVFCHVAEHEPGDGRAPEIVGFALWFLSFSTWRGRHGVYLEDLYVRPDMRGHGYGRALLRTLAGVCVERGYQRLEWWVLDWNTSAHAFYRSVGAEPMDEWTVWRLSGPALAALGGGGGR